MNTWAFKFAMSFFVSVTLISCNNKAGEANRLPVTNYAILDTEPYESKQKAQVTGYVYLTTDTTSKENLAAIMKTVFSDLSGFSNFKKHTSPTVIVVQVYASKDNASNMKESWIAMLTKTPSDTEPIIRYDEMRLNALENGKNEEKTSNEKKLDELNEYFRERETNLCFIYKALYDLEGQTIKEADKKYPGYGVKHSEYQRNLYKKEEAKIFKRYNISDTLSVYISIFGMKYCK